MQLFDDRIIFSYSSCKLIKYINFYSCRLREYCECQCVLKALLWLAVGYMHPTFHRRQRGQVWTESRGAVSRWSLQTQPVPPSVILRRRRLTERVHHTTQLHSPVSLSRQHGPCKILLCCTERVYRVSTTPGNLLEFKNPSGNPGNLLEFVWSSWKFLCKMSMIDCIGFHSW